MYLIKFFKVKNQNGTLKKQQQIGNSHQKISFKNKVINKYV